MISSYSLGVYCFTAAVLGLLVGCDDLQGQSITRSLKAVFDDDFYIGTAMNIDQINEADAVTDSLIWSQFNAITPEDVMKTKQIHPAWARYEFDAADRFVAYGEKHGMHIVGHALIWHSQLAPFVHQINRGDSLLMFMRDHIETVAGRYAGRIHAWDVVNEALHEDGSFRNSIFYRLLGEQYLVYAFRFAAAAAPDAELYYNDYNIEQPNKRAGCLAMIRKLQDAGVRIDGVGIQGHWHTGMVPFEDIEASIMAYASLGLKVMITELDLEVLPRNFQGADIGDRLEENDPSLNPYENGLPDHVADQQTADYARLFRLFLKHRDKISRVTFWGVNDQQSWLNGWPIQGRTNYPLLFDRNNRPKEAFHRVVKERIHEN